MPDPVRKLTIDEAVALALEQNVNLQVQRINPRIQDENVAQAMGPWKPVFSGSLSYNDASTPPDSFLQGTTQTLATDRVFGVVGVNQLLPWGQQYAIDWDASRFTTNDVFNTFNPTPRLEPQRDVHPAVVAQLQHRFDAPAGDRQPEEP